ncbi:serine-rich coiled-coil domain-containing protein 2 [Engraulis encrasicolus]|uniref:serine-rich coiled-coil domain-containing protein 2 n=1 Tax=Engraulis encrasicolus TaxID=184585 RepID=UPI002FCFAD41
MEEKASSKASMVSRLPKFGARPSGGTATTPLVNGSHQAPPSADDKTNQISPEGKSNPPGKPNGLIRAASFTLKWRRDPNGSSTLSSSSSEQSVAAMTAGDKADDLSGGPPPQINAATQLRQNRKPATPVTKSRRFGTTTAAVAISSPRAVPRHDARRSQSPKPGSRHHTPSSSYNGHPSSPQTNGLKLAQNGTGSSAAPGSSPGRLGSSLRTGRSGSALIRPRPRASSASPRSSSSRDSLSHSSDSLKMSAVSSSISTSSSTSRVSDSMVRSQSYTHIKQLPACDAAPAPIPRSYSFNRAVELAKPLANTQLRPPGLRPPQGGFLPNGRLSGLQPPGRLGMGMGMGSNSSSSSSLHERSSTGVGVGPAPPSGLRKPLLPNSMLTKPSRLAYRPTRQTESKAHPHLPLVAGRTAGDGKGEEEEEEEKGGDEGGVDSEVSSLTSPDLSADSDKAPDPSDEPEAPEDHGSGKEARSRGSGGEVLEDMSLSSASSLERNDTSEEFLDDFDNAVDQSQGSVADNRRQQQRVASSQARLRSFLNEAMWTGKCDFGVQQGSAGPLVGGPLEGVLDGEGEGEFLPPAGGVSSSLELSPSNSSGGTYMWDEEGLGPLDTHAESLCGDIFSNLDNLESCDLEDDDLMLDGDLSEDTPLCHALSSQLNPFCGPCGHSVGHVVIVWAMTVPAYDGGCRVGPRVLQPPAVRGDHQGVALDDITLKHMAQDCTFVKNQLLKLKSLLQMEDGAAIPEIPESSEDNSALQLQELTREVADLREELRRKDRTIAHLSQQQHLQRQQHAAAVRCHCQQRAPAVRGERRTHYDKSTQTPWRGPAPPVLQASSSTLNKLHTKGSLARVAPIEGLSDPDGPSAATALSSGLVSTTSPALLADGASNIVTTTTVATATTPAATASVPSAPRSSMSLPDPEELSLLLSTHLKIHDTHALSPPPPRPPHTAPAAIPSSSRRSCPLSGHLPCLERPGRLSGAGAAAGAGGGAGLGQGALQGSESKSLTQLSVLNPRVLQPPRVHKRVSIPLLLPGETASASVSLSESLPSLRSSSSSAPPLKASLCSSSLNLRQLRQLPPPSRGLPCFNAGPQALGPSLGSMVMVQAQSKLPALGLVRRERNPTTATAAGVGEGDAGLLVLPGPKTPRTLVPVNLMTRSPRLSKSASLD